MGGQTLHAVSDTHQLPIEAGIVIIGILTLIPCIAGYRYVHTYERYACIIPAVVLFVDTLSLNEWFTNSQCQHHDTWRGCSAYGQHFMGWVWSC